MKSGKKFEKQIEELLNTLGKTSSKSLFFKSPIPTIMHKGRNGFQLVFSEKALCDFYGIYREKFVLIEAKHISGKYWNTKRLKNHQIQQLIKIKKLGGISQIWFSLSLKQNYLFVFNINEYLDLLSSEEKVNLNINFIITKAKKIKKDPNALFIFFESIFLC